jgi:2-polyprenyl-3-methyl-5-hydroxy-6-metoxy-1,4-benzoquinol methylase
MPVTDHSRSSETLYQRDQYAKGGLGRWYWDYRDAVALSCLTANDARIVDIGCGEGLTLAKLISLFPQALIQGIDLLPENIAICRRFGLPVQAGDLYQLPFPDESFDAVLLMEVIEHLLQPETACVRFIGS